MLIDLHHNKIVDSLITEGFERSVREALVPLLLDKHGDGLFGIQMYEDYISDKLLCDGEWYYPLTLMTDGGALTEWIRWRVDKKRFEGGMPYAYVGEDNIEFSLADTVPEAFAEKIAGRARFAETGLIKVVATAASPDPAFLSGKCSQTFIDELARQIGPAIEKFISVSGLGDSSFSLLMTFAPETYMEHTSESVTYRRLLLSDGSSAPRDLWIKWTRLDGKGAFTVASHPSSAEILFELGEDVPRKVCEKEYRFLLGKGKDGYHRAMGRKNITEWREIIKRAVRRGELMKIEDMNEISEETRALDAMLAEVLGVDVSEKAKDEAPATEPEADEGEDEFSLAMKFVRETALGGEFTVSNETEDDENESEDTDELDAFYAQTEEVGEGEHFADDSEELLEITRLAREALAEAPKEEESQEISFEEEKDEFEPEEDDTPLEVTREESAVPFVIVPSDPTAEEYEDGEVDEYADEYADGELDAEDGDVLADVRALEPDDEPAFEPVRSDSDRREELEERIRREVEAKLRLEYERDARIRAEAEAERLREEQEKMRLELEKMREAYRLFEEERERAARERAAEEEKLRATIEQQMRAETKERERLAEAARLAVEEKRRLDEERERMERVRLEKEAEAARLAEAKRLEEERVAEAERIRREAEERAAAREPAVATETLSSAKDNAYTYVSKLVKLRFRKSVDPNITTRIYEIIKATIEYYGKEKVYLRIKARIPDTETVCLEFVEIPLEEMELLSNIIKVLGNSGLGIAKAIVE